MICQQILKTSPTCQGTDMLEYYNRQGKLITAGEWRIFTLKEGYQIVKLSKGKQDKVEVKTGWCGVRLTTYEDKPFIFITEVHLDGRELVDKRKWCETEEQALKEHDLACSITSYSVVEKLKERKK